MPKVRENYSKQFCFIKEERIYSYGHRYIRGRFGRELHEARPIKHLIYVISSAYSVSEGCYTG